MSTTPLPWKIGFKDGSGAGQYDEGIWIVGPVNAVVVCGGQDQGVKVGIRNPDDARLIERAVNTHEELLGALKQMMDGFSHGGPNTYCQCFSCARARIVIKEAEGS